ncbi:hypothetical protein DSO57_1039560 [Entomophthora muscae]|uniref:Uncharacterized protein n=1 Tax=Entomophthora muscae TaxID=34485 RepID=A0ACC2SZ67_9FUNG|nr:hypothetical protein DSO57_1039560 [Entomophthora muscae]
MSPRDFLMHLATKASGQEPSFTAPEVHAKLRLILTFSPSKNPTPKARANESHV